jgi:alkylation response protein AidB-like acyl-CoA dehydrogenase
VLADGDRARSWWTASVAAGRRALSSQLCAVLTTMLESARAHAVERRQFGRPIGSFQAVRHKLAEAHAALSGARATADMAWESDDEPLASMTAKVAASRACATVAFHAQQALAGVGFTAEHPHHRALKRALLIDRILGEATDLSPLVGRELVTRGCAPRLVEL